MNRRAASLVELVVAVVTLGAVAALAIPRFSHGAVNDNDAQLRESLATLRTAIELYYDDHGVYPAQVSAGEPAARSPEAFELQLTRFTDADGFVSTQPSTRFCFGPYLRSGTPVCPVSGPTPGAVVVVISGDAAPRFDESAVGVAWIYNCDTGYIAANSSGVDARGVRYDSY